MLIPIKRQQDIVDIFWVLLRSLESLAKKEKILDRIAVEDGYKIMQEIGVTIASPYWKEIKSIKKEELSTNKYGIDVNYFIIELEKLIETIDNRTPEELSRYLNTLANIAIKK